MLIKTPHELLRLIRFRFEISGFDAFNIAFNKAEKDK